MATKERSFKSSFTLTLLFGLLLVLLTGISISLFESDQPFLGFIGAIVIILVLVWFPYNKLLYKQIKNKSNNNKNN
jgi:hypothetical protein|nr:MAG TPA: hypothetical protein [Caudoviricetes sp.]